MNSPTSHENSLDFAGTFHVAKLLGVSVGTVQSLVERGDLQGWKTKGGHRRISLQSVKDYQQKFDLNPALPQDRTLRLLVVDDDPVFLSVIQEATAKWGLDIECVLMSSAIEALMRINELRPQVLFSDLNMPGVDGFEFLRKLRSNPLYNAMHLVAVTSLGPAEIEKQGGLPPRVTLMQKPLDMRWLHGFVSALVSMRSLQASGTAAGG